MVQERAVSLRPGASQPTKSLHTSTCTTRRPLRLRRLTSTVGSILRVTTRPRSLQIVAASPVRDFSSSDACLAKHSTCRGACHARQIKLVDTARPELPQGLGDGELVAGIDLGTTNSCIAVCFCYPIAVRVLSHLPSGATKSSVRDVQSKHQL